MITDDQLAFISQNYDHFYADGQRVGRYWAFSDIQQLLLESIGAGELPHEAGLKLFYAVQALQTSTERAWESPVIATPEPVTA
jgi:hypothetical protein